MTALADTGACELTALAESAAAHRALLSALEPAFRAAGVDTTGGLPIT